MKAKYRHDGMGCIIYDQVICEDNIVVAVRYFDISWRDISPSHKIKICSTNAEAKEFFNEICEEFEKEHYDCEYKED